MTAKDVATQTTVPNQKRKFGRPVKRLIWPAAAFVAIMTQIPLVVTIYYSLQDWDILQPLKGITFAGLSNYIKTLTNASSLEAILNTFILTISSMILCLIFGMAFALLLNRNFFAKGLVRTLIVSPFFVMPTVAGIVWKTLVYNPNFGFTGYLSHVFGGSSVQWLSHHPLISIIIIITWEWAPFFMLVLLAGLQSLPDDQLEASELDGASKFQQLIYVVIPHLLGYIEIVVMLGLMFILQIFGEIYVTTTGGPGYASTNMNFLTYRRAFQDWQIGEASAVGVITVILTIIMMLFLFMILRRRFKEELS